MIWGCFSWSGLGTASQQSSWMDWMTRLSHQWIFPSLTTRAMPRFIGALVVKVWSMRTHECHGAWGIIFHMNWTTESWLYPIRSLWNMQEKTEEMVPLSCHQYKISDKNKARHSKVMHTALCVCRKLADRCLWLCAPPLSSPVITLTRLPWVIIGDNKAPDTAYWAWFATMAAALPWHSSNLSREQLEGSRPS